MVASRPRRSCSRCHRTVSAVPRPTRSAPLAYARLHLVEQAILATGRTNHAEQREYTRSATYPTVEGDVFGRLGESTVPRVLTVRLRDIPSTDISEFANREAKEVPTNGAVPRRRSSFHQPSDNQPKEEYP